MKRVLTAVVLIPLVLLAVFKAPLWLFAAIVGLIALVATKEFLDIAEAHGTTPFRRATYIFVSLLFLSVAGSQMAAGTQEFESQDHPYLAIALYIAGAAQSAAILAPFLLLILGLARADKRESLPAAAFSSFGLAYVGIPLFLLILLRAGRGGVFYVVLLLLVVWAGDIAAYLVGSTMGKRSLAPRISPKKTWEGAAASLAASLLIGIPLMQHSEAVVGSLQRAGFIPSVAGLAYFPIPNPYPRVPPLWAGILLIITINVAAQFGDLAESVMKRGAAVKDSGTILPGHGGVLDRIDALLFAAPVVWYYANFVSYWWLK